MLAQNLSCFIKEKRKKDKHNKNYQQMSGITTDAVVEDCAAKVSENLPKFALGLSERGKWMVRASLTGLAFAGAGFFLFKAITNNYELSIKKKRKERPNHPQRRKGSQKTHSGSSQTACPSQSHKIDDRSTREWSQTPNHSNSSLQASIPERVVIQVSSKPNQPQRSLLNNRTGLGSHKTAQNGPNQANSAQQPSEEDNCALIDTYLQLMREAFPEVILESSMTLSLYQQFYKAHKRTPRLTEYKQICEKVRGSSLYKHICLKKYNSITRESIGIKFKSFIQFLAKFENSSDFLALKRKSYKGRLFESYRKLVKGIKMLSLVFHFKKFPMANMVEIDKNDARKRFFEYKRDTFRQVVNLGRKFNKNPILWEGKKEGALRALKRRRAAKEEIIEEVLDELGKGVEELPFHPLLYFLKAVFGYKCLDEHIGLSKALHECMDLIYKAEVLVEAEEYEILKVFGKEGLRSFERILETIDAQNRKEKSQMFLSRRTSVFSCRKGSGYSAAVSNMC